MSQPKKLWGGRFAESTDKLVEAFNASLDFDRLVGGERVSFEIETSPKGPRAIQVTEA